MSLGSKSEKMYAATKENCSRFVRDNFPEAAGMDWGEQYHDCYAIYSNHVITCGPAGNHFSWWSCIFAGSIRS